MPLKSLNPPSLHRVARAAALARLKEIQDISAELLRIKAAAQEQTVKAPLFAATKRGTKKA